MFLRGWVWSQSRLETRKPESRKQNTPGRMEGLDPVTAGKLSRTSEIYPRVAGDGMEAAGDAQVVFRCMWEQTSQGHGIPEQNEQDNSTSFSGGTINPACFIGPNSAKISRRFVVSRSHFEIERES